MLSGQSVQDAMDIAIVAHIATLRARVPIMAFQDGFRTSHEINTVEVLSSEQLRDMVDREAMHAHRQRGLTPLRPTVRGSNQNPDVYMQAVEASNVYYDRLPQIVEQTMEEVSAATGRPLPLFRYAGDPDPEHLIVQMGSAV